MAGFGDAAKGAAAGAAAGSVIPGIGTVAGGLVGGVAGLFGGDDDAPPSTAPPPVMNPRIYWGSDPNARADVERYRTLGSLTAAPPTIDRSYSDAARREQIYGLHLQRQGLGDTRDAMGLAKRAALGEAPSAAEIYGGKLIDDSIDSQMAMAASGRGGPTAISGAARQAAFQGAQMQQAGARDLAALRANEMAQARDQYLGATNLYGQQAGAYTGAAGGIRGQDIGLASDEAGLAMQQRKLDSDEQQFFEELGWKTNKQTQDAAIGKEKDASEAWSRGRDIQLREDEADWGKVKDVANLAAAGAGAAASDIRAKENVYPVNSDAMAQWSRSFGDPSKARAEIAAHDARAARAAEPPTFQRAMGGLSAGLAGFSGRPPAMGAYMPIRSDEHAKYIVSDERAKKKKQEEEDAAEMAKFFGNSSAPVVKFDKLSDEQKRQAEEENRRGIELQLKSIKDAEERAKREAAEKVAAERAAEPPITKMARSISNALYTPPSPEVVAAREQVFDAKLAAARKQANDFASRYVPQSVHDWWSQQVAAPGYRREHDTSLAENRRNPVSFQRDVSDVRAKDVYGSEDPMANANRAQQGSAYTYKPGFAEEAGQALGEMNVGPMANTMAQDPIAATAVMKDPNTGLLMLDRAKLSKLQSAGIASLQRQVDELRAGRGR